MKYVMISAFMYIFKNIFKNLEDPEKYANTFLTRFKIF